MLGVPKDADEKVLKAAFRKKAMEYHPDRNPGSTTAEAKFKEIGEAYEVLSDPQKRHIYDRFGKPGLQQQPSPSPKSPFDNLFADWGDKAPAGFRDSSRRQESSPFNIADLPTSEQKSSSPPETASSGEPLIDPEAYRKRRAAEFEKDAGFFKDLFDKK